MNNYMNKPKRHNEEWSLKEATEFIDHYLSGVKMRDVKIVLQQYADKVQRTYSAVAFRQKEVLSILTNAEKGLTEDKWTPEFITAVDDRLSKGDLSIEKMIIYFE